MDYLWKRAQSLWTGPPPPLPPPASAPAPPPPAPALSSPVARVVTYLDPLIAFSRTLETKKETAGDELFLGPSGHETASKRADVYEVTGDALPLKGEPRIAPSTPLVIPKAWNRPLNQMFSESTDGVLEGPPGTGKSTIGNAVVLKALATGKGDVFVLREGLSVTAILRNNHPVYGGTYDKPVVVQEPWSAADMDPNAMPGLPARFPSLDDPSSMCVFDPNDANKRSDVDAAAAAGQSSPPRSSPPCYGARMFTMASYRALSDRYRRRGARVTRVYDHDVDTLDELVGVIKPGMGANEVALRHGIAGGNLRLALSGMAVVADEMVRSKFTPAMSEEARSAIAGTFFADLARTQYRGDIVGAASAVAKLEAQLRFGGSAFLSVAFVALAAACGSYNAHRELQSATESATAESKPSWAKKLFKGADAKIVLRRLGTPVTLFGAASAALNAYILWNDAFGAVNFDAQVPKDVTTRSLAAFNALRTPDALARPSGAFAGLMKTTVNKEIRPWWMPRFVGPQYEPNRAFLERKEAEQKAAAALARDSALGPAAAPSASAGVGASANAAPKNP